MPTMPAAYMREYYQKRRAKGLCRTCPEPRTGTSIYCEAHRLAHNAREAARREKTREARRKYNREYWQRVKKLRQERKENERLAAGFAPDPRTPGGAAGPLHGDAG